MATAELPRTKAPDSTLALLLEGYAFIPSRCRRFGSDAFETRIAGHKVVCMTGADAARLFYHGNDRVTRKRAIPRPTLTLLQDFGSVQGLDGEQQRHRKAMFMQFMTPERIARLAELTAGAWRDALARWERADEVVVHDEVQEVLCAAVCAWTGVPLARSDVGRRAKELGAVFDGAGAVGPRQLRGQLARRSVEQWIAGVIEDIREARLTVPEDAPAHAIAWHRALNGELLRTEIAAVELINLLRPTVAIVRYVTFSAHALHMHPEWRERLRSADGDEATWFVQEVRRFYPFFPLVGGRAAHDLEWRGHRLAKDSWLMLDIYGTCHDERLWERAGEFDPERFREWDGDPFSLIPQGGGDHHTTHRCAGEWATIAVTKVALGFLAGEMAYDVPEQDLAIRLSRMPALPNSGFVIRDVRASAGSRSREGAAASAG